MITMRRENMFGRNKSMVITERFLTPGRTHGRTGQTLNPRGVTVHYVGNPGSSAEANRRWFENGAGGAHTSAHYIIGLNGEILLLIPENERAQHAGRSFGKAWDAMAKSNNSTYIGIECCHPDAGGEFNEKTYAALIGLCADICKRHGFEPVSQVVRHYDITGKDCPLFYRRNETAWAKILTDIGRAMGEAPPGTVRVSLDGRVFFPKAENANGFWFLPLPELGIRIRLADALVSAGYQASWEEQTRTVKGVSRA
jgi:N-acetylmuramoyl-L-alanine amidase